MSAAVANAQSLTEKTIKNLIAKADQAIVDKDVKGLGKLMSDSAVFTINLSTGAGTRREKMNKAQYLDNLNYTWTATSNYSYRRNNERISISGNMGTVTADVKEGMVMNGQYVRMNSVETATIELVNGVPLITKVTANSSM